MIVIDFDCFFFIWFQSSTYWIQGKIWAWDARYYICFICLLFARSNLKSVFLTHQLHPELFLPLPPLPHPAFQCSSLLHIFGSNFLTLFCLLSFYLKIRWGGRVREWGKRNFNLLEFMRLLEELTFPSPTFPHFFKLKLLRIVLNLLSVIIFEQ